MLLALALLAAANLLAFLVYGFDKRQAINAGWRISEGSLILLVILGGVGAWVGCEVHRHKTRKPTFRRWLVIAVALHLLLVFGVIALLPS